MGYSGRGDAQQILIKGVELLQNRGYDSCGMATAHKKKLYTTKFASKGTTSDSVDLLKRESVHRHTGHNFGIAHTRWATHGGKTDDNAHPHSDWKNRIAIIHNGTIDNFDVLREEVKKKGVPLRSQTDTEVIAALIGIYLDEGLDFKKATTKAISRLRGTWGIVAMHKDHPDGFMCARNGSPLIVGGSGGEVFIASEPLALAEHTNEYIALNDGDVVYVSASEGIKHLLDGRDCRPVEVSNVETSPAPFKHWTIKEIYEQPHALARAINFGARCPLAGRGAIRLGGLDLSREELLKKTHMLITASGTSLHAGMYGEHLFRHLNCFDTVQSFDSAEIDLSSFPKASDRTLMLALSQSGETRDVVSALDLANSKSIKCISIVNAVGSLIARMTGCGVYLHAGREVAVASTKAFTSQVAVMALVAAWFAQHRNTADPQHLVDAVHRLPLAVAQLLSLQDKCQQVAKDLLSHSHMFVLGKGFGHPVAMEGALKIKEISYIHAEGYPGGGLKHGPFALIDEKEKTPVILIVLKDTNQHAMVNAARQIKARGGKLICISDDPECVETLADHTIRIPSLGPLTALCAVVPMQLIAYHLAIGRGVDPDKPRGLAKTVTVM